MCFAPGWLADAEGETVDDRDPSRSHQRRDGESSSPGVQQGPHPGSQR